MVTIFVAAEAYAAIAGEKPDPAAFDGRGGGARQACSPKGRPRPRRELQRRHPEAGEGLTPNPAAKALGSRQAASRGA